MSQSLQSLNMFPPDDTDNTIPFPQLYHNGFPGSVQISSPQYKKENLLASNIPSNLLIQSNIHENDVYYYPSTPPLSASPSISGSPSDYSGLPTPANTSIFGIHRGKDDLISENSNCHIWSSYESPPITPGMSKELSFVHSGSLIGNESISDCNTRSIISLQRANDTPTTSPLPSQLSSGHNLDFCDPRKLTVCPGAHTSTTLKRTVTLPNVEQLSPSSAVTEEQKLLLSRPISPRNYDPKESDYTFPDASYSLMDVTSELDVGKNYFCGLSSLSDPEQTLYTASKRKRTDSGISLSNGPIVDTTSFQDIELPRTYDQFVVMCPLSPPVSISESDPKNVKRVKKSKKMSPEFFNATDNNSEIYGSKIEIKTENYTSESPNDNRKDNTNDNSDSGVSEKTKSNDLSKPQHQVTRRGRKQSETEDLTKTFVCESCNRRFKRQEHLKRHYRSVHTQEKPFKCHECGKDFSRSDNLSQHARTHGNGSIVVGLLEEGEITNDIDVNCEHIGNLGSILFNVAAAAPGSETDRSSQCSSNGSSVGKDGQSRKKRRRYESHEYCFTLDVFCPIMAFDCIELPWFLEEGVKKSLL
ncbi:hypothetical protein EPUL_003883, partial [Erysiphe pulchra]